MRAADVERSELRSDVLVLWLEDLAEGNLVSLTEELDRDFDAFDFSRPAVAGLTLLEAGLHEVVLQRAVRPRGFVTERHADNEIDIRCADVRGDSFRQLSDEVARRETAGQVDALAPRPEVAEQCYEDALASTSGLLVVVRLMSAAAQNPITSRRKLSACSRPRRGSRRRSA